MVANRPLFSLAIMRDLPRLSEALDAVVRAERGAS
jgi:hypothetical protein